MRLEYTHHLVNSPSEISTRKSTNSTSVLNFCQFIVITRYGFRNVLSLHLLFRLTCHTFWIQRYLPYFPHVFQVIFIPPCCLNDVLESLNISVTLNCLFFCDRVVIPSKYGCHSAYSAAGSLLASRRTSPWSRPRQQVWSPPKSLAALRVCHDRTTGNRSNSSGWSSRSC